LEAFIKPRDYQLTAEARTFEAWNEGHRSVLIVMPTGTGKSLTFANILHRKIKETGKKAIVVCERRELVWQAAEKIKEATDLRVDIEMGNYKSNHGADLFGIQADVIVSTIQTQNAGGDGLGRLTKFDPSDFAILVCDEAHHGTSKSYKRVFDYYKSNPELKILGVTATPDRADEEALGQIFDHVAFEYPLYKSEDGKPGAIIHGWLVPIVQQFVSATVDFSHIKTFAGDLAGAELETVLKAEKPLHEMTQAIFEISHGLEPMTLAEFSPEHWAQEVENLQFRRGIAFTRFVNHARLLADILNRIKPGFAAYVYGDQDPNERKKIIDDFKRAKGATVLANVNVLTEGYDDDGVKVIFSCCPTKSRSRYSQQIGRGTRPLSEIVYSLNAAPSARQRRFEISISDKPEILVVDFCGNSGKHKLITCADILGGHISDEAVEEAIAKARNHGRPVKMDELLEEEELRAEQKRLREAEETARKARIVGKTSYKMQRVDPFDLVQVKPVKERGWDAGKVLSPKMRGFLQKFGFDPGEFNFATGGQLIGIIKDRLDRKLCTLAQVRALKKRGIDAREFTFQQARDAFDRLNGRKPTESPSTVPPRPKRELAMAGPDDDVPF
jgi:superfamily II DNA or RNA helicase